MLTKARVLLLVVLLTITSAFKLLLLPQTLMTEALSSTSLPKDRSLVLITVAASLPSLSTSLPKPLLPAAMRKKNAEDPTLPSLPTPLLSAEMQITRSENAVAASAPRGVVSTRGTHAPPPSSNNNATSAAACNQEKPRYNAFPEFDLPFALNECKHVFLDLGVSDGRQLQTLFLGREPHSMWAKQFNEHFGSDVVERRRTVCVIGTEPDPRHKPFLDVLEATLTLLGVRIKILRNPVWVDNNILTLHFASQANGTAPSAPQMLRGFCLSTLLSQIAAPSNVLVKFDLGGEEHRVMSDLFVHETICRIAFFEIVLRPRGTLADQKMLRGKLQEIHQLLLMTQWCKDANGFVVRSASG
jgi:hypothetical protein